MKPDKTPKGRLPLACLLPLTALGLGTAGDAALAAATCERTLTAQVVVFDQPLMWNRLGAQNVNGQMYALRRDVIDMTTGKPLTAGGAATAGNVALRPDRRPRPMVLRVREGDCLTVEFQNLLAAAPNPFNAPEERAGVPFELTIDDQVADRHAGLQVTGMQWMDSSASDGANVGKNASSLVLPGNSTTYRLYAEKEGQYVINSYGATFGGEGQGGNTAGGLLGELIVEPKQAAIYRSQITREEMDLATTGNTPDGHPILNYDAVYPNAEPWLSEGKAGLPVINMICTAAHVTAGGTCTPNEIVHSEINAVVAYGPSGVMSPPGDGPYAGKLGHFPLATYPLESVNKRNPTVPNRLEPFRDFASVFHDEVVANQAFPGWWQDPVFIHTLHGVRDAFMINYGSGGIGAEIVANRLGVGPMHDCLNCLYEEFFLASSSVGDPGLLVDIPANFGLENCTPGLANCDANGPKATHAMFPADPANVHHSYIGDFVKFRNVHGGPAEQHIFHLHNHQWLFNANDDNSNYLDAQGLGPGAGYTYEINLGGSGNRNKSAGDAIFHCHFYPHFAQGMWYLWRNHDVFENGTQLAVSANGVHTSFVDNGVGLGDATPAIHPDAGTNGLPAGSRVRALPDGEITVGTPIPGLVPLPGKPMAPMPGNLAIVPKDAGDPLNPGVPDGIADSSQVQVIQRTVNPGYPFWVAGYEHSVGQRPVSPLLDLITTAQAQALQDNPDGDMGTHPGFAAAADGWDGGLPRFSVEGYLGGGESLNVQNRLDFNKQEAVVKPFFYPETGTDLERTAMKFHAQRCHDSFLPEDGTAAVCAGTDFTGDGLPDQGGFIVNGQPPVPGAPYHEPCLDDRGTLLAAGTEGVFFSGETPAGMSTTGRSIFNAETPRNYKAAVVQIDAVFNKLGYHFPQERIITLWQDAIPTLEQRRPPEPFVMRMNTFDCATFHHVNLVPKVYELDDYQVRTPTDVIGQHIHLPKWDLTTTDGAANGWNYEDGTLSPEAVSEIIGAINQYNTVVAPADPNLDPVLTDVEGNPVVSSDGHAIADDNMLHPSTHPFFGAGLGGRNWMGARTTTERWFTDPVVNVDGVDRGLGIIFTHDHFGPSTHQQVGLYATLLTEPAGSVWRHNETGVQLGDTAPANNPTGRIDGGPTSWQAAIVTSDNGLSNVGAGDIEDFREFYLEYSDFQHAYEKGVYVGIGPNGLPINVHDPVAGIDPLNAPPGLQNGAGLAGTETFRFAIQPPTREPAPGVFPDIVETVPVCVGGAPRPCPEAITANDPGMYVVNYRNEPVLARVYDPAKPGPDGKPGMQADGLMGDLAYALQSRTDRKMLALNTPLGEAPLDYAGGNGQVFLPPITQLSALDGGDPFTPMMRALRGDTIRVKMQAGGDEEEQATTIHGLKWLQGGSGHGKAGNSGWRNSQTSGISEQFTLAVPVYADKGQRGATADYAYAINPSMDGWAMGTWGIIRSYRQVRNDLFTLPDNPRPDAQLRNREQFNGVCPVTAEVVAYDVTAVLANDVLPHPGPDVTLVAPGFQAGGGLHVGGPVDPAGGSLVYNSRRTIVPQGNLVDPITHQPILDVNGNPIPDPNQPQRAGPLHDPTAILYVRTQDLVLDANGAPVGLVPGTPVEPLMVRAQAGACIEVTLRNKLPEPMPDLPNRNTIPLTVIRDHGAGAVGVTTFNNNLMRPSSYVGLHASLVEYDVTRDDGAIVGLNNVPGQLAPPGGQTTYRWYAGDIKGTRFRNRLSLEGTPIEFGGFNIGPADKIKQHQKGLIAGGSILPADATWVEDADAPVLAGLRNTRAAATVTRGDGSEFRDFISIWLKNANFYWGSDGDAVHNTESEGGGIPEDPEDMGFMAINLRSEPMWFRYGLNPDDIPGLNASSAYEAYSNALDARDGTGEVVDDPETPVFTAAAGEEFRLHLLMPAGGGRKSAPTLHGHVWQRDPYVCPPPHHLGLEGKCTTDEVGSQALGDNPIGFGIGGFQSFMPSGHFEIVVPKAGGAFEVPGDYLFRDHMGLGNLDGLWGILRVEAAQQPL